MKAPSEGIIQRVSVNEQITQYMQSAILDGRWKVGEKIPSEAELSAFFKVSQLTVRVALQQLIGMGILEKRVGDGTYVRKFDFAAYARKGLCYYMHPKLLDQICDFRLGIELKCCELAIRNAAPDEFKRLQAQSEAFTRLLDSCSDAGTVTEEEYDRIIAADLEFHRQICEMSHNELLLNAFEMSKDLIAEYARTVFKGRMEARVQSSSGIGKLRDIHQDICEALVNRDYARCSASYIIMLDREQEL